MSDGLWYNIDESNSSIKLAISGCLLRYAELSSFKRFLSTSIFSSSAMRISDGVTDFPTPEGERFDSMLFRLNIFSVLLPYGLLFE